MSCGASIQTAHRWFLINGQGEIVGRLAARIAPILCGKHKPTFSPQLDHGDNLVVFNCQHLVFTGSKYQDKRYLWHTGYPGSQRSRSPQYFAEEKGRPEETLLRAVSGMLPKNRLRNVRLERLYLYKGTEIEHLDKFPLETIKQLGLTQKPKFQVKTSSPMDLKWKPQWVEQK